MLQIFIRNNLYIIYRKLVVYRKGDIDMYNMYNLSGNPNMSAGKKYRV